MFVFCAKFYFSILPILLNMLSYFAIRFVTFNLALYRTVFVYLESAYHAFMVCGCIESHTHANYICLLCIPITKRFLRTLWTDTDSWVHWNICTLKHVHRSQTSHNYCLWCPLLQADAGQYHSEKIKRYSYLNSFITCRYTNQTQWNCCGTIYFTYFNLSFTKWDFFSSFDIYKVKWHITFKHSNGEGTHLFKLGDDNTSLLMDSSWWLCLGFKH